MLWYFLVQPKEYLGTSHNSLLVSTYSNQVVPENKKGGVPLGKKIVVVVAIALMSPVKRRTGRAGDFHPWCAAAGGPPAARSRVVAASAVLPVA